MIRWRSPFEYKFVLISEVLIILQVLGVNVVLLWVTKLKFECESGTFTWFARESDVTIELAHDLV